MDIESIIRNNSSNRPTDSVILAGGGVDSTVVLATLTRAECQPIMFFVDMGHKQIAEAVKEQSEYFGCDLYVMDGRHLFNMRGSDINPGRKDFYIPGYRMLLLTLALRVADWCQVRTIYTGEITSAQNLNKEDQDPDAQIFTKMLDGKVGEFVSDAKQRIIALYNEIYAKPGHFLLVEPLLGMSKQQIIKLGHNLKVPLNLTVTCRSSDEGLCVSIPEHESRMYDRPYEFKVWHCGKSTCYFCNQRRNGFNMAGISDSTNYLHHETIGTPIML